ncbi:22660_t:CDS:2 [Cetraspora pellucida]|uniref:22660_t:CDS:1 n=1 Tax=Cetraspora pellucida TaxID=1433469 RepID=A0A9N9AHK7_9GLOM|nr:22660_t:CDS:2 [Cetraspora pellucida]
MDEQLMRKTSPVKTTYDDLSSINLDSQLETESQQSTFRCASDPLDGVDQASPIDNVIVPTLPTIVEALPLCSEIKQISTKLWESSEAGDKHWTLDPAIRRQLDLKFIKLRQLNRKLYLDKQYIKNETHCAKVQMDRAHMKLQDVMFQKRLLKNMLSRVPRRFKFEDISLIPVDEFIKTAPEQYLPVLSEDDDTKQCNHQLLLAQLRYELDERTRLNDNYLEKLKRKEDALRRLRGKSKLYREVNKIMSDSFSAIKSLQQVNSSLVASACIASSSEISTSLASQSSIEHSNSMIIDN